MKGRFNPLWELGIFAVFRTFPASRLQTRHLAFNIELSCDLSQSAVNASDLKEQVRLSFGIPSAGLLERQEGSESSDPKPCACIPLPSSRS